MEKVSLKVSGMNQRRRTKVNRRLSVEIAKMTSKLRIVVGSGLACTQPAYGTGGVRHKGSASLIWAFILNCGNLRLRCKGKGASVKGETDSTEAQSRGGATRSSYEVAVTATEQRDCVIQSCLFVNCYRRRNLWIWQSCTTFQDWVFYKLNDGSRMSLEAHVRFCEGLGVKLPRSTHLFIERLWHSWLWHLPQI